jgi:hypothetical protein
LQAGGRRFDPVWLHQTQGPAGSTSNVEEYGFAAHPSGAFLDIVKKGYAQDAGQDPRHLWAFEALWFVLGHKRECDEGRGIGSALTAHSGWVYLDANWSF